MRSRIGMGALAAAALSMPSIAAGDLDPPGAPAPTMTDLQSIAEDSAAARSNASSAANEAREAQDPRTPITQADIPFTITEPGSYILTENVTAVGASPGITILTDNVTLDLMGFTMTGGSITAEGISSFGSFAGITIRHGFVRGWLGDGIYAPSSTVLVEGVAALGNGGYGIQVGRGSQVFQCQAADNGVLGISAFTDCVVSFCAAWDNERTGISVNSGSIVTQCSASGNGFYGFNGESASRFDRCEARSNEEGGFRLFDGSHISDCVSADNRGDGIFHVTGGPAFSGGLIRDNQCEDNDDDGIHVLTDAVLVVGNACDDNGKVGTAAGIRIDGEECAILRNHCTGNDLGLDINSAVNYSSQNTLSGNTMFDQSLGGSVQGTGDLANVTY